MLYQANFTAEMATELWGMALLYLQQTRNMSITMANKDIESKYKIQQQRQSEYREIAAVWKDRFCHNLKQNEKKAG